MPEMFVKLGYGEEIPAIDNNTNPLPDGLVWIRGMDFRPVLSDMGVIEESVAQRDRILKEIS